MVSYLVPSLSKGGGCVRPSAVNAKLVDIPNNILDLKLKLFGKKKACVVDSIDIILLLSI